MDCWIGFDTFKEDFNQYLEHLKTADNSISQKPSLVIIVLDAATIQNTINAKATEMKQRIEFILRHKLDLLFIFNKIDTISCSTKKYETADYQFYGARKLFSDHFGIPMNRIFPLMTYCSIPRKNFDHDIHIAKILIKINLLMDQTYRPGSIELSWAPDGDWAIGSPISFYIFITEVYPGTMSTFREDLTLNYTEKTLPNRDQYFQNTRKYLDRKDKRFRMTLTACKGASISNLPSQIKICLQNETKVIEQIDLGIS